MDTKEGMLRKFIRQHRHKRRHVKEIHTSASTQKRHVKEIRLNFLNMPSFVSMLTYAFPYHAFFCVHVDVWISLPCLLLCRHADVCISLPVSIDTKESMLRKYIRQHRHKRKHVKVIHTSAWTHNKAC
jgi:acetolactate synthase regulatory subunit